MKSLTIISDGHPISPSFIEIGTYHLFAFIYVLFLEIFGDEDHPDGFFVRHAGAQNDISAARGHADKISIRRLVARHAVQAANQNASVGYIAGVQRAGV